MQNSVYMSARVGARSDAPRLISARIAISSGDVTNHCVAVTLAKEAGNYSDRTYTCATAASESTHEVALCPMKVTPPVRGATVTARVGQMLGHVLPTNR
jgi:hypothetical protein